VALGKQDDGTVEPGAPSIEAQAAPSSEGVTTLGANVRLEGDLTGGGTVSIEGHFKGRIIHEGQLVIAESAHVEASVRAHELLISGRLEGDVVTSGRLELTPSARLFGSIRSPRVAMSGGASLVGDCAVAPGDSGGTLGPSAGDSDEAGAPEETPAAG